MGDEIIDVSERKWNAENIGHVEDSLLAIGLLSSSSSSEPLCSPYQTAASPSRSLRNYVIGGTFTAPHCFGTEDSVDRPLLACDFHSRISYLAFLNIPRVPL